MAFAALGITEVEVFRKLRIGILSTGSELASHDDASGLTEAQIRDSNGPYIEAVLSSLGVEVTKLGIVKDNAKEFELLLSRRLVKGPFDVIITTGAVSMGKFDFVGTAIEAMGAETRFHRVAIRPGHPILFATLPGHYRTTRSESNAGDITPPFSPSVESSIRISSSEIAFFVLPGNPLASAVCLRFLVIPYLRSLRGLPVEETSTSAILLPTQWESPVHFKKPVHLQAFWHDRRFQETGNVTISVDQGSNKIRPLLEANCWVGIPSVSHAAMPDETVETFEMYPPSLGL